MNINLYGEGTVCKTVAQELKTTTRHTVIVMESKNIVTDKNNDAIVFLDSLPVSAYDRRKYMNKYSAIFEESDFSIDASNKSSAEIAGIIIRSIDFKDSLGYWIDLSEIPKGWYHLVYQMINDLSNDLQKYNITINCIKCKFGQLRVSFDKPVPEEIQNIVDLYEKLALVTCTHCGTINSFEVIGYYKSLDLSNPLCLACRKKLNRFPNASKGGDQHD